MDGTLIHVSADITQSDVDTCGDGTKSVFPSPYAASMWREFALFLKNSLRVRPCISYENGLCKGAMPGVCWACAHTVKTSELRAFLELELGFDEEKIARAIEGLKNIGWIKLRQCASSTGTSWAARLFRSEKVVRFTEDGEEIVLFMV